MYYVMQEDARCGNQYVAFSKGPTDDGEQWRTGERLRQRPDVVEMASHNEKLLPFSDMALNNFALHVYSPKLRQLLQSLGATNIEYVPALLIDLGKGLQRDDYGVANILGKIECLDLMHAKVTRGRRVPIIGVEEFALLEDRIVPLPGMKSAPLLFRLAEEDSLVIAHEVVKAACETHGITAVRFTPTVDYR